MDPNDLQLALSYAELAQSLAFNDFLRFQHAECERLELAALNAPAHAPAIAIAAVIAWQQRRLVIRTLEETVRDSSRAVEVENEDARLERTDRLSRANW